LFYADLAGDAHTRSKAFGFLDIGTTLFKQKERFREERQ
jgi:hypothetical protein